jgi:hypothetical protein
MRYHCCCGKVISITYSECVSVPLVIPHNILMRRIILSAMTFQALQHFSTLSHKRHDFQKKKVIEHRLSDIFTTLSGAFLTARRT